MSVRYSTARNTCSKETYILTEVMPPRSPAGKHLAQSISRFWEEYLERKTREGDEGIRHMLSMKYHHSNKAGNIGDVWKHFALAKIMSLFANQAYEFYLETHCGEGMYLLDKSKEAEWGKGIGRVKNMDELAQEPFMSILRSVNHDLRFPGKYPGSIYIARKLLKIPSDKFILFDTKSEIATFVEDEFHLVVKKEDGATGLRRWFENNPGAKGIVFVDPPCKDDSDWKIIPDFLSEKQAVVLGTIFIIWYPVFAYTKPDRLIGKCRATGLPFLGIECIVDKPKAKPSQKLKGSGIIVLNSPLINHLRDDLSILAKNLSDAMKSGDEEPQVRIHSSESKDSLVV